MFYKLFNRLFSVLTILIVLVPTIALLILDPLQVFHVSMFYPGKFYITTMREASYSIIKYANYDSIIVGSSIASNFSANEASSLFRCKFINMAIDGCTLLERGLLLKHLFQVKKPKIIISSVDEFINVGYINNFNKLYGNVADKLGFYLNNRIMRIVTESIVEKNNLVSDLDCPAGWYNDKFHSERFGGFENWIRAANSGNSQAIASIKAILEAGTSRAQAFKNGEEMLDKYLLRFCRQHNETEFLLFLPPYSKLYWKTLDSDSIKNYKRMIRYLIHNTSTLKNVHIFCFDLKPFTNDIRFYKDRVHYNKEINSFILRMMKSGDCILNTSNVENFLEQFEKSIDLFNLKPFIKQIKISFRNCI